jgi:hypothetical protein
MDEHARQRQFEEQFLGQLRTRAQRLTRVMLPADRVAVDSTSEGVDAARDTLRRLEIFDRDALERLPGTQAIQIRFERSHMGGLWSTTVARLRARVLAPFEALAQGQPAGPVGREAILDALARYRVLPRAEQPSGVVFASASGFTPDAQRLVEGAGLPTLVLMGLRADGGWDVSMSAATRRSPWGRLFEFETQDDRLRRLVYHLEQGASQLDSRGMPVSELAEKLGVGAMETELLVRRACRTQPRLMTIVHEGTLHVCRSPLADEGDRMSLWAGIRKLFGMKPSVSQRVRDMTAQRVRLEQQRHEVDQRISKLEEEERTALAQGAAAGGDAERRQVANRLMRIRRDLGRVRSQANIYTQQIDILGTHIHHLTLSEQGRRMELPRAEDLTREAAQAEQVLSDLSANADLVRGIEITGESSGMAQEEQAIMDELRQLSAGASAPPAAERAAGASAGESAAAAAGGSGRAPAAPVAGQKSKARPETG